MTARRNDTILFELKGASLLAAQLLEKEIHKELETVKPQSTGYLNEIQESWEKFYDGLVKRLKVEQPDLLALVGLLTPVVQVEHEKDALPRAYIEYPHIFASPEENPRYFMYVPVDYQGRFFRPRDGVLQTPQQEAQVGELLFADGFLGNAPLVSLQKTGTDTPDDYEETLRQHYHHRAAKRDTHTQRVFLAGGDSLKAVEDFDRRTKEYHDAANRVREAIKDIVTAEFPQLLQNMPEGEALRADVSYSYGGYLNGKTQMTLSVRKEGKADIWEAGKTVELQGNDAYTLSKRQSGAYFEYTVEPRRDTEAGRKLAALMDALPQTPSLGEYKELRADFTFYPNKFEAAFGIGGKVPQVRKFGGRTVLVYNTEAGETGDYTPPGATPLSLKAYKWLEADERDRNRGAVPPPLPQELKNLPWPLPPVKPAGDGPKP